LKFRVRVKLLAHSAFSRRLAYDLLRFLFLTIPVRQIISSSTGPIVFAELVELWLWMNDLKVAFRSLKVRHCGNQFCGLNPGPIYTIGFAQHSLGRRTTRSATAALDACKLIKIWTQANQSTDQLTVINMQVRSGSIAEWLACWTQAQ